MKSPIDENAVMEILQTQVEKYDSARRQLVAIQGGLSTGGWSDDVQAQLHELAQGLQDEQYRNEMQRWNQSNQRGSEQLRRLLDRVKSSLREVLEQLSSVEETARNLRDDLVPRMNLAVRGRQAITAYGRAAQAHRDLPGSSDS